MSPVNKNMMRLMNTRIEPDRAYPLHFTHPQLLLLLPVLPLLSLLFRNGIIFEKWNQEGIRFFLAFGAYPLKLSDFSL